ncbi:phage tail [Chlorella sorokiniana]|jgi:hypothetical protein|uniref:Phage tail n=1 Tax=Chlorella sorokiniana TaxID=3076 RepID=A0A2P6TC18_CHLSO|nr:phage tail [Chlorella sorokiniana]|eukprot:PRW20173.1 phage tail [Chlorella sorokiniana]
MKRRAALLAACALLLVARPTEAGIFDSVTDGLSSAVSAVGNAVTGAANAVANTATDAWDKVSGWSEEAWSKTKNTFVNAYEWTECKAVDVAGIDLDACWSAPPSNPCTEACKTAIDKMPQDCLDRIMTQVVNDGDQAVIQRLETQFAACNVTFNILEPAQGAALFDNTIAGCETVDFVALNATACETALETTDASCPTECVLALGELPQACVEGVMVRNATTPAEVLLETLCLPKAN